VTGADVAGEAVGVEATDIGTAGWTSSGPG
jgi:hypothetical protein